MNTALVNGTIFTGTTVEKGKAILVTDNKVVDIVSLSAIPSQYHIKDLNGLNIAPAFIDLQIYGGNGKLFSHDISVASLQATYEYCLQGGCTRFMITMATNTIEKFLRGFEVVKEYWQQGGRGLIGLHLEGPYINPAKRGAHLADCIKQPSTQEVSMLLQKGQGAFRMMTLAPEQCDEAVIDQLLQHNIILSTGHSNATYQQTMQAFDKGIPAATHLFNAMSPLQHRAPGVVGAAFNHHKAMSSIVCDGIHVDFAAVHIARTIMQQRLFFITDAVTSSAGEYPHILKDDHYILPDGTLSGSALTMMQCVKNGVEHAGIELAEALRMASAYPAQLLQDPTLGKIAAGTAAEFVVFNDSLTIEEVIC
ncbi:MAG: N-acetylglucosamine-6-phosphate deacetylase [Chitinophagaceae bacterium]